MTKKKDNFIARFQRNEVDGNFYVKGDTTALDGLSDEQLVYVLCMGFYACVDTSKLPEGVLEKVNEGLGG